MTSPFPGPATGRRRAAPWGLLLAGLMLAHVSAAPAATEAVRADALSEPAVDPGAVRTLAEALRANREALAAWRWKTRVEIRLDGVVRDVQYFQVRADAQGRRRTRLIGGEAVAGEGGSPLARSIATAPSGSPTEQGAPLRALAESYAALDPQRLPASGPPPGALTLEPLPGEEASTVVSTPPAGRFVLRDLLQTGDAVEVTMAEDGRRPARFDISTSWQGAPAEIAVEFSELPNGPFYDGRTSIQATVEGRAVELVVESFDFAR